MKTATRSYRSKKSRKKRHQPTVFDRLYEDALRHEESRRSLYADDVTTLSPRRRSPKSGEDSSISTTSTYMIHPLEEQCTFAPDISCSQKVIPSPCKTNKQSVFDRLYEEGLKKEKRRSEVRLKKLENQMFTFSPKTNVSRLSFDSSKMEEMTPSITDESNSYVSNVEDEKYCIWNEEESQLFSESLDLEERDYNPREQMKELKRSLQERFKLSSGINENKRTQWIGRESLLFPNDANWDIARPNKRSKSVTEDEFMSDSDEILNSTLDTIQIDTQLDTQSKSIASHQNLPSADQMAEETFLPSNVPAGRGNQQEDIRIMQDDQEFNNIDSPYHHETNELPVPETELEKAPYEEPSHLIFPDARALPLIDAPRLRSCHADTEICNEIDREEMPHDNDTHISSNGYLQKSTELSHSASPAESLQEQWTDTIRAWAAFTLFLMLPFPKQCVQVMGVMILCYIFAVSESSTKWMSFGQRMVFSRKTGLLIVCILVWDRIYQSFCFDSMRDGIKHNAMENRMCHDAPGAINTCMQVETGGLNSSPSFLLERNSNENKHNLEKESLTTDSQMKEDKSTVTSEPMLKSFAFGFRQKKKQSKSHSPQKEVSKIKKPSLNAATKEGNRYTGGGQLRNIVRGLLQNVIFTDKNVGLTSSASLAKEGILM